MIEIADVFRRFAAALWNPAHRQDAARLRHMLQLQAPPSLNWLACGDQFAADCVLSH